ncbi:helix-turn-helix transcriptional regulator [Deinococcus sp. KSM4-11]|uniref:helix-turn-helix domain-containing protein n=1 Tax=Deinococcus sp. KSM4-11 TaxID=2568654 RepID=UPI001454DDD9|nr:helix-turn-helix transcriptional regulator [Deinococcus sp. KSM4-11]
MNVRWKVKEYLEDSGKSTYALWKASGLSRTTAYAISSGEMKGMEFDTLGKLIGGLEKLTGKRVELSDVLEVVR